MSQNLKFVEAKDFANLNKLEIFDLSQNPLKTLKKNVFDKLENLRDLDLGYCELESLPEKIFSKLTKLEEINLWGNELTHLKKELFVNNLELKKISFHDNKLQKIDVDFTKLPNIKEIWMTSNDCVNLYYHETYSDASSTNSIQEFQSAINQNCTKRIRKFTRETTNEAFEFVDFECKHL
jgi:Leucine-rich repeat (LRR) protein